MNLKFVYIIVTIFTCALLYSISTSTFTALFINFKENTIEHANSENYSIVDFLAKIGDATSGILGTFISLLTLIFFIWNIFEIKRQIKEMQAQTNLIKKSYEIEIISKYYDKIKVGEGELFTDPAIEYTSKMMDEILKYNIIEILKQNEYVHLKKAGFAPLLNEINIGNLKEMNVPFIPVESPIMEISTVPNNLIFTNNKDLKYLNIGKPLWILLKFESKSFKLIYKNAITSTKWEQDVNFEISEADVLTINCEEPKLIS